MYPQQNTLTTQVTSTPSVVRNESLASILSGTSEALSRAESLADGIETLLGISCPKPEIAKSPSSNVSEHSMLNRNAAIRLSETLDRIKAALV